MATTTPVLGLYKPTVGADDDDWGSFWNSNADTLDTQVLSRGSGVAIVGTNPSSTVYEPLWWDSNSGQLFVRYDDGSSVQWVSANSLDASTLEGSFLPLTGGTVTGPVAAARVLSDISGGQLQINSSGNDSHQWNWAYGNTRWYGHITGPDGSTDNNIAANKFLWTDAADISGGNGTAAALLAQTVTTGNTAATNTSTRQAMHSHMVVLGQIGATPTLGPAIGGVDFVSQLSTVYAVASQGGLGGWTSGNNPGIGYFRGSLFGGNDNAWLDTGASNYFMLVGREIDVGIYNSANVYQRFGLFMVGMNSARQAAGDDAAIAFVGGTNGHRNAIQFGTTTGGHYLSDALIKVVNLRYPSPVTSAYFNGIDFTAATFSGNALATPGFSVDGGGVVTAQVVQAATGTFANSQIGSNTVGATPILSINANASAGKMLRYMTAGSPRWDIVVGNAESSGNAGSDLVINRYTDAGTYLGTALQLTRSTGAWAFAGNMGFNGTAPIAKPTGVAVTIAAVHAALVSYGLIAP